MRSHHISLLEVFGDRWGSYYISLDSSHVSYGVYSFNINSVHFFNVLFQLWLRKSFVNFEEQSIVWYIFSGSFEDDLVLKKLILRMFLWEILVLGSLDERIFTSIPYGLRKYYLASFELANILPAFLGMKVDIVIIFTTKHKSASNISHEVFENAKA